MWGIIKFSKRIIRPHAVANNEVLDLLSRIPDDEELVSFQFTSKLYPRSVKNLFSFFITWQIHFRELSLQQPSDAARRDPRKKKQS